MCPGDVPRYPKEVSAKKMDRKNLNLKNLSQISETSPYIQHEKKEDIAIILVTIKGCVFLSVSKSHIM